MYREMSVEPIRPRIPIFFVFVVILILAGFLTASVKYTYHARNSHPEQVSVIERCFNGGGTLSETFIMPNGRYSQYCKEEGSRHVYWRILECRDDGRLVISQFKQAFRNLQRLFNYINNHQMEVSPVPC